MVQQLSAAQNPYKATAHILKILADPTRLRLLKIIQHGEHNVTALRPILRIPQPAVSHHLSLLKDADLILSRRTGRKIFYRLNDKHVWTSPHDGSLEVSLGSLHLRLGEPSQNGEISQAAATNPTVQIETLNSAMTAMRT